MPTLMDVEKIVDERGFEPPASSLRPEHQSGDQHQPRTENKPIQTANLFKIASAARPLLFLPLGKDEMGRSLYRT